MPDYFYAPNYTFGCKKSKRVLIMYISSSLWLRCKERKKRTKEGEKLAIVYCTLRVPWLNGCESAEPTLFLDLLLPLATRSRLKYERQCTTGVWVKRTIARVRVQTARLQQPFEPRSLERSKQQHVFSFISLGVNKFSL